MTNILDVSDTVAPKSDQLNFDDVAASPIQATVIKVTKTDGDQPVSIHFDQGLRPYKPCKSMRRVLIHAWGENGNDWVGRSMIIFGDPTVKFGGSEVGGIRISHLSDIERDMSFMLTVTRAKRQAYSVKRLVTEKPQPKKPDFEATFGRIVDSVVNGSNTIDDIVKFFAERGAALTEEQLDRLTKAVTPKTEPEPESVVIEQPEPQLEPEPETEEPDIF